MKLVTWPKVLTDPPILKRRVEREVRDLLVQVERLSLAVAEYGGDPVAIRRGK